MKVWINGTFDILHIGHIRLLNFAKSFGSIRVGLDTDVRVSEKKGIERRSQKQKNKKKKIFLTNWERLRLLRLMMLLKLLSIITII
jgi:cytidyltransferase-like protein